jgi:hypothetical protein
MTKAQVFATCWGKPHSINTTRTASGTREQLVYRAGDWAGYIYLTDGVVTAIQH